MTVLLLAIYQGLDVASSIANKITAVSMVY